MTASRISGPLNIGPTSPSSEPSAIGTVVLCQTYELDVTAVTPGTGEVAFRLPSNSTIVGMDVVVEVASDSGTSAAIKLANATGDIITGFDAKSSAGVLLSLSAGDGSIASVARFLDPVGNSDGNLLITYTETGAATVGTFHIRLFYLQGDEE